MAKAKATPKAVVQETVAPINVANLLAIVEAGAGGVHAPESVFKPLLDAKLVEVNTSIANEAGECLTRATLEGVQYLAEFNPPGATAHVKTLSKATVAGFVIEDSIPVPSVIGRGRTGQTKYPFDILQPGQSFFIADIEGQPKAAKSLASTVSSASARYAVEQPDGSKVYERKFLVRAVTENGIEGARIWRTI